MSSLSLKGLSFYVPRMITKWSNLSAVSLSLALLQALAGVAEAHAHAAAVQHSASSAKFSCQSGTWPGLCGKRPGSYGK